MIITKFARFLDTSSSADKVKASHAEKRVERIILGDLNGEAGRVALLGIDLTTLGLSPGLGILMKVIKYYEISFLNNFCTINYQ